MQEIIVYRNPVEAALWKFVTSANFFPFIVGFVVFFVVLLASDYFFKKIGYNKGKVLRYIRVYGAVYLAAFFGIAVIWVML